MSFSGLSSWIKTFEQRIDDVLDIKHDTSQKNTDAVSGSQNVALMKQSSQSLHVEDENNSGFTRHSQDNASDNILENTFDNILDKQSENTYDKFGDKIEDKTEDKIEDKIVDNTLSYTVDTTVENTRSRPSNNTSQMKENTIYENSKTSALSSLFSLNPLRRNASSKTLGGIPSDNQLQLEYSIDSVQETWELLHRNIENLVQDLEEVRFETKSTPVQENNIIEDNHTDNENIQEALDKVLDDENHHSSNTDLNSEDCADIGEKVVQCPSNHARDENKIVDTSKIEPAEVITENSIKSYKDDNEKHQEIIAEILQKCDGFSPRVESHTFKNILNHFKDTILLFKNLDGKLKKSMSVKDDYIRQLKSDINSLSANSASTSNKNEIDKLRKEFSLRLGVEEQRNQKLSKENISLKREHAKYEIRLSQLDAKEAQLNSLQEELKHANQLNAQTTLAMTSLKKESSDLSIKYTTLQSQIDSLKEHLESATAENEKYKNLFDYMKKIYMEDNNAIDSKSESTDLESNINIPDLIKMLKSATAKSNAQAIENDEILNKRLSILESEYAQKEKDLIRRFEMRENSFLQRIEEVETSLLQLSKEKYSKEQQLRKEISSLQESLNAAEEETQLLLTQHISQTTTTLSRDITNLSQKLERDQKEWESSRKQLERTIIEYESKLQLIQEENASLRNDFNEQKRLSSLLSSSLNSEKENNAKLNQKFNDLQVENHHLQSSLNSLQSKKSKLKAKLHSLKIDSQINLSKSENNIANHQIEGNDRKVSLNSVDKIELNGNNEIVEENTFEEKYSMSLFSKSHHSRISSFASSISDDSSFHDTMSNTTIPRTNSNARLSLFSNSHPNTPNLQGSPTSFLGSNGYEDDDYMESFPSYILPDLKRVPTQLELLQIRDAFRKQNEYLNVMNQRIHSLQQKNEHLTDQLLEQRTALSGNSKTDYQSLNEQLRDKELQIITLTQDLTHVKEMFRSQICELLDEIERLKNH